MTNLFEQPDPAEAIREELVNKWKDKSADELLAAKIESDLYIKTLEKQKDELREDFMRSQQENQTRANLQDLIDRLNVQQLPEPQKKPEETNAYDPKAVEQLVLQKIAEGEVHKEQQANYHTVQNKLNEKYGRDAASILREQATALRLSEAEVNELARKSPEAFFRVMGLNDSPQQQFQTPPRNDRRNDNYAPQSQKRTYSFYQEMRKKNPDLYWNPKTQVQLHKDGESQGVAFFDDGEAVTHNYF